MLFMYLINASFCKAWDLVTFCKQKYGESAKRKTKLQNRLTRCLDAYSK